MKPTNPHGLLTACTREQGEEGADPYASRSQEKVARPVNPPTRWSTPMDGRTERTTVDSNANDKQRNT